MNENQLPHPDSVDELLGGSCPAVVRNDLREALLRQTTRVLRQRRWLKRSGYTTALAACYLAGVLTMRFFPSYQAASSAGMAQNGTEAVPPVHPPEPPLPAPKTEKSTEESPLALEWQAFESKEKRPDLLRKAGDRYLTEAGDVRAALRCYRNLLESGSEEELAISPNDNWLLMALKDAKQKEKRRAKVDG